MAQSKGERNWKEFPPTTKEEGLECALHLHREGMRAAREKYGDAFNGRVELRGNMIAHVWADGTEDLYQVDVDFIQ